MTGPDAPAPMQCRRFGTTDLELSCITLGGIRFRGGSEKPRDVASAEGVAHCVEMVRLAREAGINHFEAAGGYGRSEYIYGKALNEELGLPRDSYYLMPPSKAAGATGYRLMAEG